MVEASLNSPDGYSSSVPMGGDYAPWLALGRVKGLGCVSFKKLAAQFGDPTKAFAASKSELEAVEDLRAEAIDGLMHFDQWAEVENELNRVRAAGVTLIPFSDANYPARLRTIADPPPVLYVKGELRADDSRAVAIVGSRSASDYGRRVARDLARGLAATGFTVVSGMARGIDGMAHETAINSGGRTIAILGSGVERAYPPEHDKLYQRISDHGAVLSELPIGTRPMAFNFPARNRLISGVSLGVVVVEATEKSGSLITASLAVDQGREVFAVPGEVGASRSRGAHRLIRQGAKLVENVEDILEEIAPQLLHRGRAANPAPLALPQNAGAEARKIFALLEAGTLQVDEIIEKSALGAPRVLEILLELELQGYVRQLAGKSYAAERTL
jgi:DNA processing protein